MSAATAGLRAQVGAAVWSQLARVGPAERVKRSVIVQEFQGQGVCRRTLFRWVDAAIKAWPPVRRTVDLVLPPALEAALPAHMVVEIRIAAAPAAATG